MPRFSCTPTGPAAAAICTVGADIALLRLNTIENSVNPATINYEHVRSRTYRPRMSAMDEPVPDLTGMVNPSGTKRAGNNVVDLDGSSVIDFNDKVLFEDFDSGSAPDNVIGSASPAQPGISHCQRRQWRGDVHGFWVRRCRWSACTRLSAASMAIPTPTMVISPARHVSRRTLRGSIHDDRGQRSHRSRIGLMADVAVIHGWTAALSCTSAGNLASVEN